MVMFIIIHVTVMFLSQPFYDIRLWFILRLQINFIKRRYSCPFIRILSRILRSPLSFLFRITSCRTISPFISITLNLLNLNRCPFEIQMNIILMILARVVRRWFLISISTLRRCPTAGVSTCLSLTLVQLSCQIFGFWLWRLRRRRFLISGLRNTLLLSNFGLCSGWLLLLLLHLE